MIACQHLNQDIGWPADYSKISTDCVDQWSVKMSGNISAEMKINTNLMEHIVQEYKKTKKAQTILRVYNPSSHESMRVTTN